MSHLIRSVNLFVEKSTYELFLLPNIGYMINEILQKKKQTKKKHPSLLRSVKREHAYSAIL